MDKKSDSVFHPAWAAGMLDGAGVIEIYLKGQSSSNFKRRIYIDSIYKPALESLKDHYGGNITPVRAINQKYPSIRTWRWELSNRKRLIIFLVDVLPYLVEKKEQAEILLANLRGKISIEEAIDLLFKAKKKSKELS